MEIEKSFYNDVLSLAEKFIKFENLELEGRYVGPTSKLEFDRCIEYCMEFSAPAEEESLDILAEGYRITIKDKQAITEYCQTNLVPNDVMVIKKSVAEKPIMFEAIDFKITEKSEVPVDGEEILEKLHALDKSYRYKKRYSFTNIKDGVRIDLTIVKASMGAFKNFMQAHIIGKPEKYEIEVECVARKDAKTVTSNLLNNLFNLYRAIVDEEYVCSKQEKKEVIEEYLELCYKQIPKDYHLSPKMWFAGPQPVTLEQKNIVDESLGNISIKKDYTVTEKADGERYLLYVSTKGRCYFINNRLTLKYSGVQLTSAKSILMDGEFITSDVLGNYIKHFAIFDAYYYDGVDVRKLSLLGKNSRLSKVDAFLEKTKVVFGKEDLQIYKKNFLSGEDIFAKAEEVLSGNYPYKIDGLIFTPIHNPVGAMYPDQAIDKPVGTWPAAFKWKPQEDNTIDFFVKFKRGSSKNPLVTFVNSAPHRILELYVGYDPIRWDRVPARKFLEGNFVKTKSYLPCLFKPPNVLDDEVSNSYVPIKSVCMNGDIIEDDSIVEFKYDNSDKYKKESLKWIPVRVRKDKTELYRTTKSLSGAVNDLGSALNVWRSISYPVTRAMITGAETIENLPPADDLYYDRYLKRNLFASVEMMNFHNFVKNNLIQGHKGESVLDLACGKGGDFKKFIDAGFTRLLGYDSNRDNIENPQDGAYSRLYDFQKNKNLKYVMLPYDLSQKIDTRFITDADDKHVASVIYGQTSDPKLAKYAKMGAEKFDLVSCQFAIHYFFETERKLDNFLSNVDMHIAEGGYFIGTCLDGKAVKQALLESSHLQGTHKGRVLWDIKKAYTRDAGVYYGEQVEVFMESIGRVFKEYLVNIDILHKKLKVLGYDLIENKNFREYFDPAVFLMDDIQQKYSFLNMSFVFKKAGSSKPRVFKKKVPVEII